MSTFVASNQKGKRGERAYLSYLAAEQGDTEVSTIVGADGVSLRDMQREYGDYKLEHSCGAVEYVEVKTDFQTQKYGNLFCETESDTGELTGNQTPGWFGKKCSVDTYVWMLPGLDKIFFVLKKDIEDYVIPKNYQQKTISNYTLDSQPNRSKGYIVPFKDVQHLGTVVDFKI